MSWEAMEVSMSKTRRGKYTDNRICYISKCKGDMRLYLRRKGKLPCFSYLVRGKSFSFYRGKIRIKMEYTKDFFEKVFSSDRMKKYFLLYPGDEVKAIKHYQCNIMLSEAMYPCLSVFEVELRNSVVRELVAFAKREDWYVVFSTTPGLMELNKYISTAKKQIAARGEDITTAKITAELTWGFWTSLFNRNYERILWKDLRRAFPFVKKANRQRKVVASFLNKFRRLRNRIDHNEAICWNLDEVEMIHDEMMNVMGWMNKEVPIWLSQFDRFSSVSLDIRKIMDW